MHASKWSMLLPVTRKPLLAALILGLFAGCAGPPIDWEEPSGGASTTSDPLSGAGGAILRHAEPCVAGLRVARDSTGGGYYAVWWAPRPDSTADLVVAHSSDGAAWDTPVKVDTLDTARVNCRRMPPSIAADAGNVHVSYSMAAREGPGIFASHSMDRGKMFHSPVAVVYGERIGQTAIAARGSLVAVAYEDPNTTPRRIGLALSSTMAHLFQSRTLVSPPSGDVSGPGVVLGDSTVTVTWTLFPRDSGAPRRMMRRGRIR